MLNTTWAHQELVATAFLIFMHCKMKTCCTTQLVLKRRWSASYRTHWGVVRSLDQHNGVMARNKWQSWHGSLSLLDNDRLEWNTTKRPNICSHIITFIVLLAYRRKPVCLPPPCGAVWCLQTGFSFKMKPVAGGVFFSGNLSSVRRRWLQQHSALLTYITLHLLKMLLLVHPARSLYPVVKKTSPPAACRHYISFLLMKSLEWIKKKVTLFRYNKFPISLSQQDELVTTNYKHQLRDEPPHGEKRRGQPRVMFQVLWVNSTTVKRCCPKWHAWNKPSDWLWKHEVHDDLPHLLQLPLENPCHFFSPTALWSFSIFTSLLFSRSADLCISSHSSWPRPPLTSRPVHPYSRPDPSLSLSGTNFVHLSICLHIFQRVHHSSHPILPLCPLPSLLLILTLPCSLPRPISLLPVTLHLPVFVSPSFQEFIRRMCCFPNSIAPHQLIYSHSHT